jgi:hypothetical protein
VTHGRDRGVVDVSIEMLMAAACFLLVLLSVFEAAAYWHAHQIFDDAAAEGARVAAAFDGSCAAGVAAARAEVARRAGGWAGAPEVSCADGPVVAVTVTGTTPGVLGRAAGMRATVRVSVPKER